MIGRLVVQKHKYFFGGGSYDWYWLVGPDGENPKPLGEDARNFNAAFQVENSLTRICRLLAKALKKLVHQFLFLFFVLVVVDQFFVVQLFEEF